MGAQGQYSRSDALLRSWTEHFSSCPLLPTNLHKIQQDRAQVIFIMIVLLPKSPTNVNLFNSQHSTLPRSLYLRDWQGQASQPRCPSRHSLVFGWVLDLEYSCSKIVQAVLNNRRKDSTKKCYLAKSKCFCLALHVSRDHRYSCYIELSPYLKMVGLSCSFLWLHLAAVQCGHAPMDSYSLYSPSHV